jgi:hypothetical protein
MDEAHACGLGCGGHQEVSVLHAPVMQPALMREDLVDIERPPPLMRADRTLP